MEWLLILALAVWVWLQSQRLDTLTRQVRELEWRMGLGRAHGPAPQTAPAAAPVATQTQLEPLLLDTPLPAASNDDDAEAPEPSEQPALVLTETAPEPPAHEPIAAPQTPMHTPPPAARVNFDFAQWLAENGFAWIGGAALALGGAFLVAFAAQAGFFTPPLRLLTALVLGGGLIGAAEWVRRGEIHDERRRPLVGALLAGAGAATLYMTAWAAHGLYHYIDTFVAALALGLCAALLAALSMRHGQPLAVLAIGAALLAPALSGLSAWPSAALTLYVCAVGASGFALAMLRRWAWTAAAALAGLYVWFAACVGADRIGDALIIALIATLGAIAASLRQADAEETHETLSWRQITSMLPTIALCISSVLLLWTWFAASPGVKINPAGPALAAMLHVALAAMAVRRRVAHPAALAVATGALVLGLALSSAAQTGVALGLDPFYLWPLVAAPLTALAALGARPHRHGRALVAGAGAIGAALLVVLAAVTRASWHAPEAWAPLLAGAASLMGAAMLAARHVQTPQRDWSVDLWVGASAALALIGMESLAPALARPAADAAIALGFATVLARRGWRGAGASALTAAALALTHALAPDFSGAVISGAAPLWGALLTLILAASLLFAGGYLTQARAQRDVSEALSSAGILALLIGGFLALHWFSSRGAATPLGPFTENALRALMLMVAGYIVLPRGERGRIAALRGHVLMAAGLFVALFGQVLLYNPWWGSAPAALTGPLLFNAQALAFAAPAALAGFAARRLYSEERTFARLYAAASAFLGLIWAIMEIRHCAHPGDMVGAEIGLIEGQCYGLTALALAVLVALVGRLRGAAHAEGPFTSDLNRSMRGFGFAGLGLGGFILLLTSNPWWGAQNPALTTNLTSGVAVLVLLAAALMALLLGRLLSRGAGVDAARFAAAAGAVLFAWAFGHDAIRWLHQHGAMDDNAAAFIGMESFGHALWPLAFVLIGAQATARAPGRDTIRAYLYDMQAIWSTAIWPALIWAALGLWLMFNPWWGAAPAISANALAFLVALATLGLAAYLSTLAPRVPRVQAKLQLERAATIACVGHIFVALSLAVRFLYHGPDMRAALEGSSLETWSYSALWAIFGGAVLALGTMRRDPSLRWCGAGLLLFVTGKVLLFDMAALSGVIRAASFIALGLVLTAVTLLARRQSSAPSSRDP